MKRILGLNIKKNLIECFSSQKDFLKLKDSKTFDNYKEFLNLLSQNDIISFRYSHTKEFIKLFENIGYNIVNNTFLNTKKFFIPINYDHAISLVQKLLLIRYKYRVKY